MQLEISESFSYHHLVFKERKKGKKICCSSKVFRKKKNLTGVVIICSFEDFEVSPSKLFYLFQTFETRSQSYKTGVARLFWSRAKFENYFSLWAAQFKISDDKVTIFATQNFFLVFFMLLTKFLVVEDLYFAFSQIRKSSKGCTLAMSAIKEI